MTKRYITIYFSMGGKYSIDKEVHTTNLPSQLVKGLFTPEDSSGMFKDLYHELKEDYSVSQMILEKNGISKIDVKNVSGESNPSPVRRVNFPSSIYIEEK